MDVDTAVFELSEMGSTSSPPALANGDVQVLPFVTFDADLTGSVYEEPFILGDGALSFESDDRGLSPGEAKPKTYFLDTGAAYAVPTHRIAPGSVRGWVLECEWERPR